MNASATAREKILASIRAGNAEAGVGASECASIERRYQRAGTLPREDMLRLMVERLREYDAEVVECGPAELAGTIAAQLTASGRKCFVAPAGLPADWMAAEFEWRVDRGLSQAEVESAKGVVTGAFCAVAESGTIVLHHGLEEGRRILTLLPDWHLCVLRESQVVETLPEYFAKVAEAPRLATYISGPSATADIEMTRIKGVHGPRLLHVLIVRGI